jgi:hypothetical protein
VAQIVNAQLGMADLLGLRINTAVTWGQTMKRDWYSFVAAKI